MRQRLENRRASIVFEIELHGLRYTAGASHFPDGRLAEIFLQNHKLGSQADANARDSAVAANLALQFGCPLETLRCAAQCRATPTASPQRRSALRSTSSRRKGGRHDRVPHRGLELLTHIENMR
jgi:hypothetical protein